MSFLKSMGLYLEDDVDEINETENPEETEVDTLEQEGGEGEDENEPPEDDEDDDEQLEKIAEERRENNKFKELQKNILKRLYPYITPSENAFLRKMEKKGLNRLKMVRFRQLVAMKKQKFWHIAKIVAAVAGVALICFGIYFLGMAIATYLETMFPWLKNDSDGGNKGAASPFGIKGDKFYGGRLVYRDDVLSRNGLIEQYVDIVETSVENLQGKIYTSIEADGENYDVKVEINLTETGLKLPGEDFDYENLDLSDFANGYAKLYQIVGDIAKLVYKTDNDAEAPANLVETLDGIKYFGFNGELIGSSIVDDDPEVDNNIIEIVYDALTEDGVITLQEKLNGSSDEYANATKVTIENIDNNLRTDLVSTINVDKNKIRTEKLFIKDIILDGDDKYMEGIEKKNYVALIYMPKENVDFSYVSYMITIDESAQFSMVLTNNGSEISLTKGEGEDLLSMESSDVDVEISSTEGSGKDLTYMYKSGENLNQTANTTDVINTADLNKFTNASSLFKVVTEASDYNVYLEASEEGNSVLTYKKGNMYVLFETDAEFYFNEEIKYGE